MNRRFLLLLLSCLMAPLFVCAQTAVKYSLDRHDDGHYYFHAPMYGQDVEIMLESGIPALLVGQDFYEKRMKKSGLKFEKSNAKMRLMNNVYQIIYQSEGRISLGKTVFDGPIFVLDGFNGISMPLQFLKTSANGKHVVMLNLPELYFEVGGTLKRDGTKFKLNYEKNTHRPFINANFTIDGITFDGKLLVDMGCPMFLFLFRQHRSVNNAIVRRQIELKSGYNAQGQRVSMGFNAKTVKFYGAEYKNLIIGVTGQYRNETELGFLGTPYFDAPVYFDFDDGWMYKVKLR